MSPAPQYHSVNNVDIEHAPDIERETMPRQGSSNDNANDSPDSGSGSDPNVSAHDNSSSDLEGGHSRELRLGPGLLNNEPLAIKFLSWTLLSPRKQQQSSLDLFGRPKIPQWPYDSVQDIEETAWRMVDKDALEAGIDYYTSPIGINVQDLDLSGNSTEYEFDVESDYIGFDCSFIGRNVSRSDLRKFSLYEYDHNGNATNLADIFTDASPGDMRPSSFVAALQEPIIISATPHMLYTSWSDGGHYYVLNCTADNVNLRTTLACTSQGCSPQRQLRMRNPWPAIAEGGRHHRRLYAFQNALAERPRLTYAREGLASATENYIANDDNVFADQGWRNWTDFDTEVFSRRVTTAFNTVWHAGMDWYNVTKSSPAVPEDPGEFWTNKTEARITRTEDAYYVNRFWVVVLMLTTTILQVLAVGGLVLRYLIRGPDILGYASALTRDNQFASISGGSHLDGAERARSLRSVRVQLADVKPEESCGYIALNVVPFPASAGGDGEEGKGEDQAFGHMDKGRMYALRAMSSKTSIGSRRVSGNIGIESFRDSRP
ncbi:hypothetical protein CMUS01_13199 [Colletotrichum musicola]|uniref:Uncharacterized protein n=1 Tax=Colletotrichum musicola TaxID=2175873 RepID=A0A8H6MXE3_9PEZI|nr:hypothetical protein CMUS01_13199 [Colletotrichum musicola]